MSRECEGEVLQRRTAWRLRGVSCCQGAGRGAQALANRAARIEQASVAFAMALERPHCDSISHGKLLDAFSGGAIVAASLSAQLAREQVRHIGRRYRWTRREREL